MGPRETWRKVLCMQSAFLRSSQNSTHAATAHDAFQVSSERHYIQFIPLLLICHFKHCANKLLIWLGEVEPFCSELHSQLTDLYVNQTCFGISQTLKEIDSVIPSTKVFFFCLKKRRLQRCVFLSHYPSRREKLNVIWLRQHQNKEIHSTLLFLLCEMLQSHHALEKLSPRNGWVMR